METKQAIDFLHQPRETVRARLQLESPYYVLVDVDESYNFTWPQCHARHKNIVLEELMDLNPLAKAVYDKKVLASTHPAIAKPNNNYDINNRPISFFTVHEFLEKTRHSPEPAVENGEKPFFTVDGKPVSHNKLQTLYAQVIPNSNLAHTNGKSYLLDNPLFLPIAVAGLVGLVTYNNGENFPTILETVAASVVAAVAGTYAIDRLKYGRNVTMTAPWNSSLYMDTNIALFRDYPQSLHMGIRAAIRPKPTLLTWPISLFGGKTKQDYYPASTDIANDKYLSKLVARFDQAAQAYTKTDAGLQQA